MKRDGKDPERLEWIRGLPCELRGHGCEGRIDPHHRTGAGLALRAPDSETMPLCRKHHRELHDCRGYFEGWVKAELKIWQLERVEKYQDMYTAHIIGPT